MTEVPEHLLRRSREAKAAAKGGTDQGTEAGAPATDAATSSSAVEQAAAASPAPAGGGGGAARAAAPAAPSYTGPPQPPPRRQRVPMWAMPVVVVLPFWALLYAGAFGERNVEAATGPAATGARIYGPSCGGCHGQSGGGGTGPALADVTKTFPNFADHVAWVKTGSAPFRGQAYGAGSRVATGNMPGFENELSEEEIIGVVCHERVRFGGAEDIPECAEGASPDAGEGEGGEGEGGETATEENENVGVTAGGEAGG